MGCFWHYLHSVEGLSWLLEHVCFVISPCCLPDISNYYMPNHYQRWWWATTQKSNNARVLFFFFLSSKCLICNFSRQRKKIWHCVSTHGALTAGLRPDQHIFALLARFGSLGLHPLPWNRSQLEGALFYLSGAQQRHMCKWLKQNFHQAI